MVKAGKTKKKKLPKPLRDELKRRNILPASVADRKMPKSERAAVVQQARTMGIFKSARAEKTAVKAHHAALAKMESDTEGAMAAPGILQADRASGSVHTVIAGLAAECHQLRYAAYKADQLRRAEKQRHDRLSGTRETWLPSGAARDQGIVHHDPLLNIGPGIYGRV